MKLCLSLLDIGAIPISSTKHIDGYVFRGREIDFDSDDEGQRTFHDDVAT